RNVIRLGVAATKVAAVVLPEPSMIDTVGVGLVGNCPAAVASDPGAMAVAPGFAAERTSGTLAAGVGGVDGVRETPRRTSPAAAVRSVVNCSLAAEAALVLARTSLMLTSLFGSAPLSPLALTVEVVAQIVTVPSGFTFPAMLRRPSVEGFSEVG